MTLYPTLTEASQPVDQTFRLGKTRDIDLFLSREVEDRRKVQKRYLRAVNVAHWISTGAGIIGVGLEATGIPLMVTGVGTLPGILLSALGAGAFGVNLVCDVIIRRCSKKALKHAEIARCASDKLNSIHKKVSDGLRDANISAEEFDRILEEESQYQRTKEEIRAKARTADLDALKKEYVAKGRQEEMAKYAKFMASVNSQ